MIANGIYTIEIAAILSGPDNEEDYQGFAFVKDSGFAIWKSKRGQNGRVSTFEWYAKILEAISLTPDEMAEVEVDVELAGRRYTVVISKRCSRCNRRLTTPESIRAGIGPVCAGRE